MNIVKNIIKFFLIIVVLYYVLYFIAVYKDVILSIGANKTLTGKIIYSLSGVDIKTIDFPSGRERSIYSVPQERKGYLDCINSFSFSPDGNKVVFAKMDYLGSGYKNKLYIMNSDGTDMKKLLDLGEDTNMFYPCWSPNGKYIAFAFHRPYKHGGLYVFNVTNPYGTLRIITDLRPAIHKIAWSPDSRKIAFISDEYITKTINEKLYVEFFVGRIFLINDDGTDLRPLTIGTKMSWSPDSTRLVYEGEDGFYVINEDGSNRAQFVSYSKPPLSFVVGDASDTAWSPDGKYIAFIKEIWPGLCGLGIYVVPIDNPKKQIRIATDNEAIIGMSWVK